MSRFSAGRGHGLGPTFQASLRTRLGRDKLQKLRKRVTRREKTSSEQSPFQRNQHGMGIRLAAHLRAWAKFAWKRFPVDSTAARLAGRRRY